MGNPLGFLAGPWGMAATTGVGLLQGYLQGNTQRDRYNRFQTRLNEISSPEYLNRLTQQMRTQRAGEFSAITRGSQLSGQAAADATRARFARAGLSGVGERVSRGAETQAIMQGRQTSARLSMEIARMAAQQRDAELRSMQALMNTPYGNVSPISSAIAGAGSGLEAAVNAAYANELAGAQGGE